LEGKGLLTIHFLYGRRESLTAKSEAYKKAVRKYMEALGFSQTTDSFVEGTFEDMTFYNPTIEQGRRFLVEAKAVELSLADPGFADELVKYFRMWSYAISGGFKFYLFATAVKKPEKWREMFSETGNEETIRSYCKWYNASAAERGKTPLSIQEVEGFKKFLFESEVNVVGVDWLEAAACEKEDKSAQSMSRKAKAYLKLVSERASPLMKKSTVIMNILPVQLPQKYYVCESTTGDKTSIFEALKDQEIPPFVLKRWTRQMYSFLDFNEPSPLAKFTKGQQTVHDTSDLQLENPALCSEIVNVFLGRIAWNRGMLHDKESDIWYFPAEKGQKRRTVKGPKGRGQWAVKRYDYLHDSQFGKKGQPNFFFHKGLRIDPTSYFGETYIEFAPKKYYTKDGSTQISGEERKKLDLNFRNPQWDRANTRVRLMRFWRFILLEPLKNKVKPEPWLSMCKFGDFVTQKVDWSPSVVPKYQKQLWDFTGGKDICE
jgi:hypothetical protein